MTPSPVRPPTTTAERPKNRKKKVPGVAASAISRTMPNTSHHHQVNFLLLTPNGAGLSRHDGVGLDLGESGGVYQFRDLDHRGRWPYVAEDLAVSLAQLFPLADVDDEHARADDVRRFAPQGLD